MSTTDTALPYTQRVETIQHTALAGQKGFFLPRGTYARQADILAVQVNGTPIVFGIGNDYVAMKRQARTTSGPWVMPTTADVTQGVWLAVALAGGETVRITFVVRSLLLAPPVPMAIYAPGEVLPVVQTIFAFAPGTPLPTNGILRGRPFQLLLTARKGLQVEFWRKTLRAGKTRPSADPSLPAPFMMLRAALNWSPYWRSGVAAADGQEIVQPYGPMMSGGRKRRFRLAYYDPASGARSALSNETVFVVRAPDTVGMPATKAHLGDSVWVR